MPPRKPVPAVPFTSPEPPATAMKAPTKRRTPRVTRDQPPVKRPRAPRLAEPTPPPPPRPAPVDIPDLHPVALSRAMEISNQDVKRLRAEDTRTVVVLNRPRSEWHAW